MQSAPKLLIGVSPRILRQVQPELGFGGKTLQYLEQSVGHWVMSLGALVAMVPTVERDSLIRHADIEIPVFVAALDQPPHPARAGDDSRRTDQPFLVPPDWAPLLVAHLRLEEG